MKIEWDLKKAKSNLKKHGGSFEEAATALSDPMAATGIDPDHSITYFCVSERGRFVEVSHTGEDETIRIISARRERELYEER
jgi:hypothetical protein